MKWFYIISLLAAAGMVASPYWLLTDKDADAPERIIVRYTPDGQPVWKDDPVVAYDSLGAAVKSIDPTTCGDTTSSGIQGNMYEGLYEYHFLLRPPKIIPLLAAEMPEISSDRLTYTIRLKKGALYHRNPCFGRLPNGTYKTRTVRAEDFILAYKRVADYHNTKTSLSWAFLGGRIVGLDAFRERTRADSPGNFSRYDLPVAGLKALDDHTLQIKLTQPFPQFIYVLAMDVYAPCPREAVDFWLATASADPNDPSGPNRVTIAPEKRMVEFTDKDMVIGTGAYMLQTFKRKQKIVLVRNPDYRLDEYPSEGMPDDRALGLLKDAGRRVPFIDAMCLDFVPEDSAVWMRFLTKQTDASGIPRDMFDSVITPGKDLTDLWKKRNIFLNTYSSPIVFWYAFNMEDDLLGASRALRQAMCLCYDVETQIQLLANGRGRRAVNIIPSSFAGWSEAGPGPYYRLDLEQAKVKIAQARRELAARGLLDSNGEIPVISLDFGGRDENTQRMADFAQQQFAKIGLRTRAVLNDWPTLQEKVHNKNVQCYTMGWHADYPDAENFLQLFYTPNIKKGTNDTNYSNPEFDRLYEKVRVMSDSPRRTALYAKMIRMVCEDVPVLMLSEPLSFVLYSDWNFNVKPHPVGYGYLKYRRIDVDMRRRMGGRR